MSTRVYLRGGLGNQFFQWMHARQLAHSGKDVALDTSFLRAVSGNQASGKFELLDTFIHLNHRVIHTPQLWRIERVFSRLAHWTGQLHTDRAGPASARLHYGYFQVPLDPSSPPVCEARTALAPHLRVAPDRVPERYIAVHMRLGDYTQSYYNRSQLGILGAAYYADALAQLKTLGSLPCVVVSDNYAAARELCATLPKNLLQPVCFLDQVLGGHDCPTQALQALLNAEALVCANSSFSAMAGYLGRSRSIYAPRPWFRSPSLSHLDAASSRWTSLAPHFRHP